MNLEYAEHNAAYIATMEEAIERLKADGRFLTTQSLYTFVGEAVAGSKAKVGAFLHERGDARRALCSQRSTREQSDGAALHRERRGGG